MRRVLVISTRNRYLERIAEHRGERSPEPSRCGYDTTRTTREVIVETARRFAHRNPRRIPGGIVVEGDQGDVQTITVEER